MYIFNALFDYAYAQFQSVNVNILRNLIFTLLIQFSLAYGVLLAVFFFLSG